LNVGRVARPVNEGSGLAGAPWRFIVATFVAAAVIGGLVLYFGLHGQLGGPIP